MSKGCLFAKSWKADDRSKGSVARDERTDISIASHLQTQDYLNCPRIDAAKGFACVDEYKLNGWSFQAL